MKRSKFTEEQIAFAPHQADTGTSVEEVCRKVGISQGNPPLFSGGEFKGSVQHSVKDLCRCFELKRFARPGI